MSGWRCLVGATCCFFFLSGGVAFSAHSSRVTPVLAHDSRRKQRCEGGVFDVMRGNHHRISFPPSSSSTQLLLHLPSYDASTTQAAAATLLGSAWLGRWAEQRAGGMGIVVTLSVAALAAHFWGAPAQHPLYEACWNTFLPASLAFLLLSLYWSSRSVESSSTSSSSSSSSSTRQAVINMALPFALACMGSIVGCVGAFGLFRCLPALHFSPAQAAVAAACLAASFVGGSVNFFATARWLAPTAATTMTAHTMTTLVSAMAATDVMVMAVYFAALGVAVQSTTARTWFEGTAPPVLQVEPTIDTAAPSKPTLSSSDARSSFSRWKKRMRLGLTLSGLVWVLVQVAQRFEQALSRFVPGTACGFLALVTPRVGRLLSSWLDEDGPELARDLAGYTFLLLFAAMGVTANLPAALISGPACLIFSLLALFGHVVFTVITSYGLRRAGRWASFTWADVWIASNAAVGGPATAATFCSQIPADLERTGRTLAATVWGIVGYAVGTTVGVAVYRLLAPWI